MERFTEEHSKCLLVKEWLVKVHNRSSTPYLFKFFSSTVDLSCYILVTDTKSVWTEVLNSNQFSRRWRELQSASVPFTDREEEEVWRVATLELLAKAHSPGNIADATFDIVSSNYSDLAVEFEWESFKWKWETCFLGHRTSADIISKHLIFPLITLGHLALSSPESISTISDADVENAVDKVGRMGRRAVDMHIKNTVGKPRFASTLRRITAIFNIISDLPPVISVAERPELVVPEHLMSNPPTRSHPPGTTSQPASPQPKDRHNIGSRAPSIERTALTKKPRGASPCSATESEEDNDDQSAFPTSSLPAAAASAPAPPSDDETAQPQSPPHRTPNTASLPSDSDSSPVRPPPKKQKTKPLASEDEDEDSEAERKRRMAMLKSGGGASSTRLGTKQPIKRGGKRF